VVRADRIVEARAQWTRRTSVQWNGGSTLVCMEGVIAGISERPAIERDEWMVLVRDNVPLRGDR
jgi:hypothetical protein